MSNTMLRFGMTVEISAERKSLGTYLAFPRLGMRFRVLALAGRQPLRQRLRRLVCKDSLESASSREYLRASGAGKDFMSCHYRPPC
jgi:hypothetical protein